MKILLFGEFSGFYNSLKTGLIKEGHEVFLASDGDGYKNYPSDFRWDSKVNFGKFNHIIEVSKLFLNKKLFRGYDVVLLIKPTIFSRHISFIRPIYDFLIENNEKVFLSGAGLTAKGITYWYDSNEKYHNYVLGNMNDRPIIKEMYNNRALIDWEEELISRINGYLPIWYEYAQPYRDNKKLIKTLRIPIDLSDFKYKENRVKDKIVFFHGISDRKNAKGTPYIMKAFDIMREKYSEKAEFIAKGGLPFTEYRQILERSNVIVDDANSYSIAMNGLFSLAMGKIVFGGAEPVANKELGLNWNPVFNICPDVDQICTQIESIINKRDEIEIIGQRGRRFVEEYHDDRDIAKQYIDVFERY